TGGSQPALHGDCPTSAASGRPVAVLSRACHAFPRRHGDGDTARKRRMALGQNAKRGLAGLCPGGLGDAGGIGPVPAVTLRGSMATETVRIDSAAVAP